MCITSTRPRLASIFSRLKVVSYVHENSKEIHVTNPRMGNLGHGVPFQRTARVATASGFKQTSLPHPLFINTYHSCHKCLCE